MNIGKFKIDKSFQELNNLYDVIYSEDIKEISYNGYKFNNTKGDITKDIIWTWAINKLSVNLFIKFIDQINLINNLNQIYNNEFHILGISFITLNKKQILEEESTLHYDILSQYDLPYKTNILTVLLPMKYNDGMGGLEYIHDDTIKQYIYKIGEYIAFDSSKIKHRTLPFKIDTVQSRVLISINLASKLEWAETITKKITLCQGNTLSI